MTSKMQAGFTLTEALVSLFVFALVAAGSIAMLGQSVQAQGRVSEEQETLRSLQVARSLLVSDIAQIAPRLTRASGQAQHGVFFGVSGADPQMSFVRAVGERGAIGSSTSLVAVEYALNANGQLVRSTRSALDPGPAAQTSERVLLPGATDILFEFHDGLRWREGWPAFVSVAPRAVAIIATVPKYGTIRLQALTGL